MLDSFRTPFLIALLALFSLFVLVMRADAQTSFDAAPTPYVDCYGQKIAANWPEKTRSDSDLAADAKAEQQRLKQWDNHSQSIDEFGGSKTLGWHTAATGYFTTEEHDGVWWLITPNGYPCFYRGIDTTPALKWETTPVTGRENIFADLPNTSGKFAGAWGGDSWGSDPGIQTFAFGASNLIRKYGPDWQVIFRKLTQRRLAAWGFTGIGKWGDPLPKTPMLIVLNRTGVPIVEGGNHPDPFDPATSGLLKNALLPQILPHLKDPTVIAWSLGNEGAEIVYGDEILGILSDIDSVPAKKALVDYAVDTLYGGDINRLAAAWGLGQPVTITRQDLYGYALSDVPEGDIEALREYYTDEYYALVENTIKSIDPHHLYAGFWIVEGFITDGYDWVLISRHCDILGFDSYDFSFASNNVNKLIDITKKPVLCGEFSFPQSDADRGFSQFGELSEPDEKSSGLAYSQYMKIAASNPYCVGLNWFQYRDEPVTGRGPGHGTELDYGENYAFGLVDIADRPKWTLLNLVRAANLTAASIHASAKPIAAAPSPN